MPESGTQNYQYFGNLIRSVTWSTMHIDCFAIENTAMPSQNCPGMRFLRERRSRAHSPIQCTAMGTAPLCTPVMTLVGRTTHVSSKRSTLRACSYRCSRRFGATGEHYRARPAQTRGLRFDYDKYTRPYSTGHIRTTNSQNI